MMEDHVYSSSIQQPKVIVPYFHFHLSEKPFKVINDLLDNSQRHHLDYTPWTAFPYKPTVDFAIAHSGDGILLKFFVREKAIRAVNTEYNSPVYEDSCVEFFIQFNDDAAYYNLEINCIGTILFAYGTGRAGRKYIPNNSIKNIVRQATISYDQETGMVYWEMSLIIPMDAFEHHDILSLSGKSCRGNFYKCGDHLPEPHFLTWADMYAVAPDFHLPEFFGTLRFL